MEAGIKLCGVCFSYGANEVLTDISFEVECGDFVGLVGPNGSGKSTLLKNMAGVLRPFRGEIYVNHTEIRRYRRLDLARMISMVGQDQHAGFNFLVEQVVETGRFPYRGKLALLTEAERQTVERAMHLTGCHHLRGRDLFSLSGGERRRVFLARALAQETPLLLLDEPTVFLDIAYQFELLELLQELNAREKLTVVAVMHDLNLASRYCGKLFMLDRGKLFDHGSPAKVLTGDNLSQVYRTEFMVKSHPLGNFPLIIPVSPRGTVHGSI